MIEIKHKGTGAVLRRVEGATLAGVKLRGASLSGAELFSADLSNADLSNADLSRAHLYRADLSRGILTCVNASGANLCGADLSGCNLVGANLSEANLSTAALPYANFAYASMYRADLFNATLSNASLYQTEFSHARLCAADLSFARLVNADLFNADLSDLVMHTTAFTACTNLSSAVGLTKVRHHGPSTLDHQTLRACIPEQPDGTPGLPDAFLLGVGYTEDEIANLRAVYGKAIRYYSCFISYARSEADFAERLRADLRANNISVWMDTYDMRGGNFWRAQIDQAIKVHDKLIVVCSRASLCRPNVVEEILAAIAAERAVGTQKLFPIALDDFYRDPAMEQELAKLPPRARREDWYSYLQDYHIPDFSGWKDHDTYQREFRKLLRDLKEPGVR